jgi:hypothetical protein
MSNIGTAATGTVLTGNGAGVQPSFQSPATNGTVTSVTGTANQVNVATGTTTPVISLIGPYTPATYTTHGVLIGEGTSSIVALAAGTAGQVLQSGGASADPVYSTATYPASSGGSGKILYDNGTNFVESVPTFPASASATSRKIIVSDGTNWLASTETWAVPGSSGNVLTSDGTNWTSAAVVGPGGLTYVTKNITSAQIKALHGTPIQVVAAPASGHILQIIGPIYAKFNYGGSNVFVAGASQTINLIYGATGGVGLAVCITNAQIVGSSSIYNIPILLTALNGATNIFEAQALNLSNPIATEITGNAGGNNTITVSFWYANVALT